MNDEGYCVYRGGCWGFLLSSAQVALCGQYAPAGRGSNLGVRLVRLIQPLQQLGEVKYGK